MSSIRSSLAARAQDLKDGSYRVRRRLWSRISAFWRETTIARWLLSAVLFFLLLLFHNSLKLWFHRSPHVFHLTKTVLDFVTLYLAISGILYAIIHEMRLSDHVRQLRAIEESLSTQRVGRFPQFLDEIGKLLHGASRIRILADCADYGSFFAPEDHFELHDAICRFSKVSGRTVQLLVAGPPAPLTATGSLSSDEYLDHYKDLMASYWPKYIKQLHEDGGFLDWLEDVAVQNEGDHRSKLFEDWLHRYQPEMTPDLGAVIQKAKAVCDGSLKLKRDASSSMAFKILLQARQYWFEKRLKADRVDIRHVDQKTPLFLWISHKTSEANQEDEGVALFAFPSPHRTGRKSAIAFRTIDSELIRIFENIFDEMWPPKPNSKESNTADGRSA